MAGQLLQISFRGLLNVHSRYGPRDALAPVRSLFSECFNPFVTSWTALSASGWNISFPAGIFTREAISTFQDTHNNASERNIRPISIGRKNWLFFGSDDHADAAANLFSLVATCKLHGIDPEGYLTEVIRVMPYWPRERYLELSPRFWAETRTRLVADELARPIGHITVPSPAAE
jgi:hypothetical protein